MAGKSTVSELEKILRSLPQMNAEEREISVARLKEFGIDPPGGPVRRPGIECPFTQMQVVSPCNLTKCKYHIKNDWSRNCILEYIEVQGSESLAVEEIAFLYSTPTEKVESIIEQGMLQLRENSKETVGFDGDFERASVPEIQANVEEDDEFSITAATLAPPFLKAVNPTLEDAVPAADVFQHPAIRLLGVLDTIISELE
jgi:hypothetical protein